MLYIETENIKQYATEYAQIKRGFADSMEVLIRNGKADEFNYSNQTERLYVILSYICRLGILNKNYECVIECFCGQMPYDYYEGLLARSEIIVTLLSPQFRTFYCIDNYIHESNLIRLFDNMDLNEFETLIVAANLFAVNCFYEDYKDIFIEADDYYCEYDIDGLLKENIIFNGCYSEIDQESVVEIICDYIREDVEAEVYEKVKEMPENILQQIRIMREYVCINIAEAPKTAASAVLKASLGEDNPPQGEDKYFSYLLLCNTDFPSVFRSENLFLSMEGDPLITLIIDGLKKFIHDK